MVPRDETLRETYRDKFIGGNREREYRQKKNGRFKSAWSRRGEIE